MIANILAAFYADVWALRPDKWEVIAAVLKGKHGGKKLVRAIEAAKVEAAAPGGGKKADFAIVGRTAIVPIMGTISKRITLADAASGGVSADAIGRTLDSLGSDKQVKNIVLQFDSPGGSVQGIPELASKISALSAQRGKSVVAVADAMAASAAYWLAACANEIVCTPSGEVGSVGVIAAHIDESAAEEAMGLKTTLITSTDSPYKGELSSSSPLSEAARADLQAKVDSYHAQMVAAIASGRGMTTKQVNSSFGQGRMMMPAAAKAAGMIDRIATMEETLGRLEDTSATDARRAMAAEMVSKRARIFA